MPTRTLTSLVFLFACGAEEAPVESPESAAVEAPGEIGEEAAEAEVETPYSIHEWGFIAHHHAVGDGGLVTTSTAPSPQLAAIGHGIGVGRGGKPVLYVHLEGEGNIARFTASLSGGRFVEEWPHSADSSPTSITWQVEARRGSCSAAGRYPSARDEHCAGIDDHYCEAAELAHYETQDSACLTVSGAEWNHLFYRAQVTTNLPVRVTKSGDAFRATVSAALPGRLMRIRRAPDAADTRVAIFDADLSSPQALPDEPSQPASEGIAAIQSELEALGMTPDEIGAFMVAWQAELFGDTPERAQVEMVGEPPLALRPKADALVYFAPVASLDAMVPLSFTPPPTNVRRAVLVRVDLGEAPPTPQGTIGLGNIGNIGYGGGYGMAPRRRAPLRIRSGAIEVDGPISPDVARRIVRRHLNEIRHCIETNQPTEAETRIEGLVAVKTDGSVQSGSATGGGSDALRNCMSGAFRRWTFPANEAGESRIALPFIIQLTESE